MTDDNEATKQRRSGKSIPTEETVNKCKATEKNKLGTSLKCSRGRKKATVAETDYKLGVER